jgi:hypothetical protein
MKKYAEGGIYTAEMGKPPTDPEGVPAKKAASKPAPTPKKTVPRDTVFREGMPVPQDKDGASAGKTKKMANGGYVRAADGIAKRGKTRGKMC